MNDQPTQSNIVPSPAKPGAARNISLKGVTVAEAREHLIQFLTAQWEQSLIDLARKLTGQGFSQSEILELCEGYRPMFDANIRSAIEQFDQEAQDFIDHCNRPATNG